MAANLIKYPAVGGGTDADAISPEAADATGAIGVATGEYALEDHMHPTYFVRAAGTNTLKIGSGASGTSLGGMALGLNANCGSAGNSHAIGRGATCDAANQLMLGDEAYPFNEIVIPAGLSAGIGGGMRIHQLVEQHNLASAATSDTSIQIPANCWLVGVAFHVATTITGATSWDAGIAGDTARFGSTLALTDGTDRLAHVSAEYTSATAIRFTANGSNFTGGAIRVCLFVLQMEAFTT